MMPIPRLPFRRQRKIEDDGMEGTILRSVNLPFPGRNNH
jgi:hypothetical protein